MTFDENDPALMAELAEIGWEEDGPPSAAAGVASVPKGHRERRDPPPAAGRGRRKAGEEEVSEAPSRPQGGNELLRSLGMSLNSMGDTEVCGILYKARAGDADETAFLGGWGRGGRC